MVSHFARYPTWHGIPLSMVIPLEEAGCSQSAQSTRGVRPKAVAGNLRDDRAGLAADVRRRKLKIVVPRHLPPPPPSLPPAPPVPAPSQVNPKHGRGASASLPTRPRVAVRTLARGAPQCRCASSRRRSRCSTAGSGSSSAADQRSFRGPNVALSLHLSVACCRAFFPVACCAFFPVACRATSRAAVGRTAGGRPLCCATDNSA